MSFDLFEEKKRVLRLTVMIFADFMVNIIRTGVSNLLPRNNPVRNVKRTVLRV